MKKTRKQWDHQSLHEEREYGFFWYDWIWRLARPLLVLFCAGILIVGIIVTGGKYLYSRYLKPVDETDNAPISFVIDSGSSLSTVAANLEAKHLIRNRSVLKYWMDFRGLGQKVQAGSYTLTKAMTLEEIVAQLTSGDGKPLTRAITVIPGWTVKTIATQFAADGIIPDAQAFLDACKTGEAYSDYYYINDVRESPKVNQRYYVLEGYLAPDTYEIYTNSSVDTIIRKLLSQTEAVFDTGMRERAEELKMTMDQVLTLASMIEKEAKKDDFAKVSAVFHNRLDRNMALGSDVTVQYSTGSEKMALTNEEISVISAYNTYTNTGLPVGPVCNPSKAAIEAALYPDETFVTDQYLYFCSMEPTNGSLYFSKTLSEHEAAVERYRPLWVEYDKSRGLE
ncbi:MAG TPA: endolytic transglycosylase MltG [Clostridia bacterium]|nr:endolytic transglycosylase MltG [Clostridia bacterium]